MEELSDENIYNEPFNWYFVKEFFTITTQVKLSNQSLQAVP